MKPYYVTTPLYYVNAAPHIGHTYTTVAADCITRYKSLRGFDAKLLTGADEHGQKVQQAADDAGMTPRAYVDHMCQVYQRVWDLMQIDYHYYSRTSAAGHKQIISDIFTRLHEQGDIYKGSYEGLYCVPCETFLTASQAAEGLCPECARPVSRIAEECYYFKMSKYADALLAHYDAHPDFLLPVSRKNEMINNFIKPGLEDLCVSRTSFTWGVPVAFDPGHVVYVWIDALPNYITALDYPGGADFARYWPCDLHLMSKEIVRFHAIIWPAILLALGVALPKRVFGHGWLQYENRKMGKSLGNAIDPAALVDEYGSDAIRYYLLREFTFGPDGNFTAAGLRVRYNADLANDLGNLLSRTVGMAAKYFGGTLPAQGAAGDIDCDLIAVAMATPQKVADCMDALRFSDALAAIWTLVRRANKYTDECAPWQLAKDEPQSPRLARIIYNLAQVLRITAILISPFMPTTPRKIREQLGIAACDGWDSCATFDFMPHDITFASGDAAFPRKV